MIFVEHDMDVVRDISDWVVVMAEGAIIAEGTPDDIGANQEVIDAYLGAHTDSDFFDEIETEVASEAEAEGAADIVAYDARKAHETDESHDDGDPQP